LENLLRIGQLKPHSEDAREIDKLLDAAQRSIAEAGVRGISAHTRFEAAYRAVTQNGRAALAAKGYRPDTGSPGQHMAMIQALTLTLEIEAKRVVVLDKLRRKRNLADYTGEGINYESVAACIKVAEQLLRLARQRISQRWY
jgi:hypothetical protein